MRIFDRRQKDLAVLFLFVGISPSLALDGEFKNYCANSLSNSRVYQTTCTVNGTIDGKIYCFGNENSKEVFMKDPQANLKKAYEYFATLQAKKP